MNSLSQFLLSAVSEMTFIKFFVRLPVDKVAIYKTTDVLLSYHCQSVLKTNPLKDDGEESSSCTPSYITRAPILLKRLRNRQTRRFSRGALYLK